jgi:hypothetical protein
VFGFLTDGANAPRVVPSVVRVEKLTDGPVGAGTRYRETRLMNGKETQPRARRQPRRPGGRRARRRPEGHSADGRVHPLKAALES